MNDRARSLHRTVYFSLLTLCCLLLAACKQSAQAPGDPVAAVKAQAKALQDNDVLRYQQLSVPPELFARMQGAWQQQLSSAEPVDPREEAKFNQRLQSFIEPGAEQKLLKRAQPKFKRFSGEIRDNWTMMKPTFNLLIQGVLQSNKQLGDNERAHVDAIADVLLDWAEPEVLTNPQHFEQTINIMCRQARALEVKNLQEFRQLDMNRFYQKMGIILAGSKQVAQIYGIDVNQSFEQLQASVVKADQNTAKVRVSYPLAGETVEFDMELVRINNRWYSASAVQQAQNLPVAASPNGTTAR
jgi:hypothetical protein